MKVLDSHASVPLEVAGLSLAIQSWLFKVAETRTYSSHPLHDTYVDKPCFFVCPCVWLESLLASLLLVAALAGMVRVRARKNKLKHAQLGAFEVGQVKAHVYHGLGPSAIAKIIRKPGKKKLFYSPHAISDCIRKLEATPQWKGERKSGSGPPRKTTEEQDEELLDLVLELRGKRKVTVTYLRTALPWAKGLGNTALEERLRDAGLAFLRRRRKTLVLKVHRPPRIKYCKWVLKQQQQFLDQWCWSDGTVFFLDRGEAENEETQRAALGTHVWRMTDGSDALFDDCVGPSCYKKGQGHPVKVWGLLADGKLHIHVLQQGETLNKELFQEIVEDFFGQWKGPCSYLVQDFEPAIRSEEALLAIKDVGLELVELYPKRSQDFNAIENVWKMLREELWETLPQGVEKRDAFIARLHKCVAHINKHRKHEVLKFSRNQKQRAQDCLASTPPGSRTEW